MPPSRIAARGMLGSGISGPTQDGRGLRRNTMGISRATLSAGFAVIFSMTSLVAQAADYPAPKQGEWIAKDFRFHTGETMPELRLHYTTIGDPSGQPVLVLHGSGGSGGEHADGDLRGRIVRRGPAARRREILHHHSRRHRPRQIIKAVGRDEDGIPEIRLRRHGRRAISPGHRGPRHQASAAGDRQFDGRHAHLAVGREISST